MSTMKEFRVLAGGVDGAVGNTNGGFNQVIVLRTIDGQRDKARRNRKHKAKTERTS